MPLAKSSAGSLANGQIDGPAANRANALERDSKALGRRWRSRPNYHHAYHLARTMGLRDGHAIRLVRSEVRLEASLHCQSLFCARPEERPSSAKTRQPAPTHVKKCPEPSRALP